MPFSARCFHQRKRRTAAGTAATAATGAPRVTPSATVAAAATPAVNPLTFDSCTTSFRLLLMALGCSLRGGYAIPADDGAPPGRSRALPQTPGKRTSPAGQRSLAGAVFGLCLWCGLSFFAASSGLPAGVPSAAFTLAAATLDPCLGPCLRWCGFSAGGGGGGASAPGLTSVVATAGSVAGLAGGASSTKSP